MASNKLAAALVALASLATVASAGSVNFEELGVQPATFDLTAPLRDQYAGLTFAGPSANDGGAILNQLSTFGFDARSGQQFLAFNNNINDNIMTNGGRPRDPETIVFNSDLPTNVEIWANGFDCNFRLTALDVSGGIIGSTTEKTDGEWTRLAFSSNAPIQAIVLTELNGDRAFAFDDLNYNNVPTPGALPLAAVGLLAAARRRR